MELAAIYGNIARLIQDFDKLDGHRRNMMEELKVLRDIMLFYHERHPELLAAESTTRPEEDDNEESTRQHDTRATPDDPGLDTTGDDHNDHEDKTEATKK